MSSTATTDRTSFLSSKDIDAIAWLCLSGDFNTASYCGCPAEYCPYCAMRSLGLSIDAQREFGERFKFKGYQPGEVAAAIRDLKPTP